jgi:DNA-binding transcriptional MerR regulator
LTEYRLDELAEASGVSARNIRAYRERGLLDPPRRVGRSAYYDDYHLSQLRTINQLLRRGFNSAHIAEFFASMREGADLADILGIQRAVLGPDDGPDGPQERPAAADRVESPASALDIDPAGADARRLIETGLAEMVGGKLVLCDPKVREIVAGAADQGLYVRALLHIHEATGDAVDGLAAGFVTQLEDFVADRFGKDHAARPDEIAELTRIVHDYRALWRSVVAHRLEPSLHRQLAAAGPDSAASALLSAQRESKSSTD